MSDKPIYHGRDHRQGGADPIHPSGGDGIRFDFDNVGDWLDIRTTGTDGSGFGMHFVADKPVKWELTGTSSDGLFTLDADSVTLDATGATADFILHSNYDAHVHIDRTLLIEAGVDDVALAGLRIQATHGDMTIISNLGGVTVQADVGILLAGPSVVIGGPGGTQLEVDLAAGDTFFVRDHLGATIFSVDEATGTTHTHGATVADL